MLALRATPHSAAAVFLGACVAGFCSPYYRWACSLEELADELGAVAVACATPFAEVQLPAGFPLMLAGDLNATLRAPAEPWVGPTGASHVSIAHPHGYSYAGVDREQALEILGLCQHLNVILGTLPIVLLGPHFRPSRAPCQERHRRHRPS